MHYTLLQCTATCVLVIIFEEIDHSVMPTLSGLRLKTWTDGMAYELYYFLNELSRIALNFTTVSGIRVRFRRLIQSVIGPSLTRPRPAQLQLYDQCEQLTPPSIYG